MFHLSDIDAVSVLLLKLIGNSHLTVEVHEHETEPEVIHSPVLS
jgi:hypothetical protein